MAEPNDADDLLRPVVLPSRALLYARVWAVAAAFHLALPDAHEPGWLLPDLLLGLGALLLAWRGLVWGWLLGFVGLAWPLLFLRDALTQSTYLMLMALAALLCAVGSREGRALRMERTLPAIGRVMTIGLYSAAVLHKLNTSFLDPGTSCANGGLLLMGRTWSLDFTWLVAFPFWPQTFLVVEAGVVSLYVLRPRLGLLIALVMHLPLTIVFAPAFAIVALTGWLCALDDDDLRALVRTWRRHRVLGLGVGLGLSALSMALYFREHWVFYPAWQLTEVVLWVALAFWALTLTTTRPHWGRSFGAFRLGLGPRRALPFAFAGFWVVWVMTPYLGLNMHHTGAMLSNVRIDHGCWNSVVMPESMRLVDPYVRACAIESDDEEAQRDAAELVDALYAPSELRRALRPVCARARAAVRVVGSFHAAPISIDDACHDWPFEDPPLPGYARFRTSIAQSCRQVCVH